MLFYLEWEIGPSRMPQVFPSYRSTELMLLLASIIFKSCDLQSVVTFSTLQAVVPIFWKVSSCHHSLSQHVIQKHFPFQLLHQLWAHDCRYLFGRFICITHSKWSAWWCTLFVGLAEIWWSVSHVTSLRASLKVANPPSCIKLSKHKHIYQNLSLRKSRTGGKL